MTLSNPGKQYCGGGRWAADFRATLFSLVAHCVAVFITFKTFIFLGLIVSISHRMSAEVWENGQSGSLTEASLWWMDHKGQCVTGSVTLRWPLHILYIIHDTSALLMHIQTSHSYMSPHSCHKHTRAVQWPVPWSKRFCSHKLSKHFCLWRPVSVFSAFEWYLASLKSNTLTTDFYFRETDWVGERGEREIGVSVCLIWRVVCSAARQRDLLMQHLFFAN